MTHSLSDCASVSRYVVLDLMRGVAALAVLLFHMDYMLGSFSPGLHKAYLAVDFFFVLSGFVISANYHVSVRPDTRWIEFLIARLARLWPLFVATTWLGCIAMVTKLTHESGMLDAQGVIGSLLVNSLMIPSFYPPFGIDRLFLFNGASWSVSFEMAVNILFFALLRKLSLRTLCPLAAVLAALLIAAAYSHGSLDGGWSSVTFHVGTARVLYGFTAGMAMHQISAHVRVRLNPAAGWILVSLLCLSFLAYGHWGIDCLLVIVGFPLLVLFASRCDLGGFAARLGGRLGDISYSVYLLQTPAMLLVAGASKMLTGKSIASFAPMSGAVFLAGLLAISSLCWRYFELPARNHLRYRLGAWQRHASQVSGTAA